MRKLELLREKDTAYTVLEISSHGTGLTPEVGAGTAYALGSLAAIPIKTTSGLSVVSALSTFSGYPAQVFITDAYHGVAGSFDASQWRLITGNTASLDEAAADRRARTVAMLDRWLSEADSKEAVAELADLKRALDANRHGERRLFPD